MIRGNARFDDGQGTEQHGLGRRELAPLCGAGASDPLDRRRAPVILAPHAASDRHAARGHPVGLIPAFLGFQELGIVPQHDAHPDVILAQRRLVGMDGPAKERIRLLVRSLPAQEAGQVVACGAEVQVLRSQGRFLDSQGLAVCGLRLAGLIGVFQDAGQVVEPHCQTGMGGWEMAAQDGHLFPKEGLGLVVGAPMTS